MSHNGEKTGGYTGSYNGSQYMGGYKGNQNDNAGGHTVHGREGHQGLSNKNLASRRLLFCDHCKMSGHIVQRCFKIHGYPPGHRLYRGRRLAASVTHDQDETSWVEGLPGAPSSESHFAPAVSLPTLNADQYQQLLTLLNKQQPDGPNSAHGTGFMAGKSFCFLTFGL